MNNNTISVRLLPVLMLLIGAVCVFKAAQYMVSDDGSVAPIASAVAQEAAEASPAPEEVAEASEEVIVEETIDPEATGSVVAPEAGETADGAVGAEPTVLEITRAEQDVLESLQERRRQLEQREQELVLKEQLLLAAEQRLQERIAEMREIEARIEASFGRREDERREQLQSLVGMYENMKPKDAARIFDRLDMSVLIDVVQQMSTRRVAPILAKMDTAVAERLTVELAMRAEEDAGSLEVPELAEP